jgi:hypothetical protein
MRGKEEFYLKEFEVPYHKQNLLIRLNNRNHNSAYNPATDNYTKKLRERINN